VHVPSVEAKDQRHLHRDLETLKQERASTTTRIKDLLSSQGIRLASLSTVPKQLEALRLWNGAPLPRGGGVVCCGYTPMPNSCETRWRRWKRTAILPLWSCWTKSRWYRLPVSSSGCGSTQLSMIPRPPGTRGRPQLKGKRWPTLEAVFASQAL
jgi:hypothetical protein